MYIYMIYIYIYIYLYILLYIFSNDTNSFTYVFRSTCFPETNIENISKSAALHLKGIFVLTVNLRSVVQRF